MQGIKSVAPDIQPPVLPVFFGFRVMVAQGFLFLLLGAWGVWRWIGGKLESDTWMLRAFMVCTSLGFVAKLAGWIVAETGHQPWIVHGLIATRDGVSDVSAATVATSQCFVLTALAFSLPMVMIYTAYANWVFRGTIKPGMGYAH